MAEPPVSLDGLTVAGPIAAPFAVLRVRTLDAAQADALSQAFDLPWPTAPNTAEEAGATTVLWLAPGEWAVVGPDAAEVSRRAASALGEALHHVADVADGRAAFDIAGPRTRGLLAQGCGLDMHPRAFAPGACAQTLFAQTAVLIHRPRHGDAFRLFVDATLSGHLAAWFAAAAPFAGT